MTRRAGQPKPTKLCVVCGRPFEWRRKWAKVWDEVRYCSKACQGQRGGRSPADGRSTDGGPAEGRR
ncbi:MAG: DUF2256 domain-containing protein [Planctomycetaceae bacterium]